MLGHIWRDSESGLFSATNRDGRSAGVCAPPSSTLSQLVAIFVSYAEKNPQRLHEEGFDIALESLQVAFPCKGRKSATPNPSFEGTSLLPPIGGAPLNSALGVAKPNNCSDIMQVQEKERQYIIWQNRSVRFYVAAKDSCTYTSNSVQRHFVVLIRPLNHWSKGTLVYWDTSFKPEKANHRMEAMLNTVRNKVQDGSTFEIPSYFYTEKRYQSVSRYPSNGKGLGFPHLS